MKRHLAAWSAFLILFFPLAAVAGPALDAVQSNVNQVLDVLRNKSLKTEAKKKQLEAIYVNLFDQEELAKLSLGRNWNKMNAAQQKEFIDLFRQILEKAYGDKLLSYTNEKVEFVKEVTLSADRTEVQTKVITASKQIPINYRMIRKSSWKVYDVVIERVSLVQNYRSQFNDILAKNTSDHLLDILRKKVKEK